MADVGGGTTDIAVVNDGGVEGTKMFGIGGRSFTKTISDELSIPYDQAEKLKVNIEDSKVKASVKKDVAAAVDKTLEVWLAGVELALSEFDAVDQLPPRILRSVIGIASCPSLSAQLFSEYVPIRSLASLIKLRKSMTILS